MKIDAYQINCARRRINGIRISSGCGGKGAIKLLVFIPNEPPKPVPEFLLICHRGQSKIDPTWTKTNPFWPAEQIVSRGYAAMAFHVSNVDIGSNSKN